MRTDGQYAANSSFFATLPTHPRTPTVTSRLCRRTSVSLLSLLFLVPSLPKQAQCEQTPIARTRKSWVRIPVGAMTSEFFLCLRCALLCRCAGRGGGGVVMGRKTRNGVYKRRNRRRRTALVCSTITRRRPERNLVKESLPTCIDVA
jgi:hypothetical protein